MSKIMSIDPGNIESAYCIIDADTYTPIKFGKVENELLLYEIEKEKYDKLIVEMIASYGMSVGSSVFDTCVWIGRFIQASPKDYEYIYRREEKMNLCHTMKAKDSNIRQALIDRFGEVGVKKAPGFFYGFKKDIWAAFAVGCTYLDKQKEEQE